jgi:hypothetical protein
MFHVSFVQYHAISETESLGEDGCCSLILVAGMGLLLGFRLILVDSFPLLMYMNSQLLSLRDSSL